MNGKRWGLRITGAVAAVISAIVHGYEYAFNGYGLGNPNGIEPVISIAFLINVVGGVVVAVLLLVWRHWLPMVLLFALGVVTLGSFVLATALPGGLFGDKETWSSFMIFLGAVAEAVAIVVPIVYWSRKGHPVGA